MKRITPGLVAFALCSALLSAHPRNRHAAVSSTLADQTQIKDKYHAIQVSPFEVGQGVQFPPEYLTNLKKEIVRQLTEAKLFQEVLESGQQPAGPDATVLRLSGTIHNYKQGNRKERYLALGVAGDAEIDARIVFLDAGTGQKLVIEEVRGILTGGAFGGNENKVTEELAREVVMQVKLALVRRVPSPDETTSVTTVEAGPDGSSAAVDLQTLSIDSKDWTESQRKLDEQAAAGYRVAGYSLTGTSTADLQLEKSAVPSEPFRYRFVHIRLATRLESSVNSLAAEGFQVVPQTLNALGPYLVVVMEKPPSVTRAPYQYKATEAISLSNAQKDIQKYQSQGYDVLDQIDFSTIHIVLFQKAASEK